MLNQDQTNNCILDMVEKNLLVNLESVLSVSISKQFVSIGSYDCFQTAYENGRVKILQYIFQRLGYPNSQSGTGLGIDENGLQEY